MCACTHTHRAGKLKKVKLYMHLIVMLVVKPQGRRPLGRSRHKWELKEEDGGDMVCILLAQDRDKWEILLDMVMNFWVL
jgi:hypothetical protein